MREAVHFNRKLRMPNDQFLLKATPLANTNITPQNPQEILPTCILSTTGRISMYISGKSVRLYLSTTLKPRPLIETHTLGPGIHIKVPAACEPGY